MLQPINQNVRPKKQILFDMSVRDVRQSNIENEESHQPTLALPSLHNKLTTYQTCQTKFEICSMSQQPECSNKIQKVDYKLECESPINKENPLLQKI